MYQSSFEWIQSSFTEKQCERYEALLKAESGYSSAFLRLCVERGLDTIEAIELATNPQPQCYHDPYLMFDMQKAIERLMRAIETNEKILIYGDYDADGITSTLILSEALETLGADYIAYLPDRFTDGYGPNMARYHDFIQNDDINIILTCDNGIAGFEAIEFAQNNGVDVIISDHHEIQEILPKAYAIIHPAHPKGNYPFEALSGAGVALKIAHALLGEIPDDALELAAIGTIADVVSLCDENRTIVMSGLSLMKETERPGLQLLIKEANHSGTPTTEMVGFSIAPLLNAVGRIENPTPGYDLLKTDDGQEAQKLYDYVKKVNEQRKKICQTVEQSVISEIESLDTVPEMIIAANSEWHAGILGIVAGKIVQKYQRPVILLHHDTEKNSLKGSGRSTQHVNLFEWVSLSKDYLSHFGGHAQAVGLTVPLENFDEFKASILNHAEAFQAALRQPSTLHVDLTLDIEEVTLEFIEECQLLAPYGNGNPEPLFHFRNNRLKDFRRIGTDAQHIKFQLADEQDQYSVDGIGFFKAEWFDTLQKGDFVDMIGTLSINEWNHMKKPQMVLSDLKTEGIQFRDFRASQMNARILQSHHAVYMCRHQKIAQWLKTQVSEKNLVLTYEEMNQAAEYESHQLVLMEPPLNFTQLESILMMKEWDLIDLGVYLQSSKWYAGLPTREECVKVYQWLRQQANTIELQNAMKYLEKKLNISQVKLKCIFHVFFEAKFVTIEDGCITFQPTIDSKVDLFKTNAFISYQQAYEVEGFVMYQSLETIKHYVKELRNK